MYFKIKYDLSICCKWWKFRWVLCIRLLFPIKLKLSWSFVNFQQFRSDHINMTALSHEFIKKVCSTPVTITRRLLLNLVKYSFGFETPAALDTD